MGFVADQQITAIGVFGQTFDVGAQTLVATNEDLVEAESGKEIEIFFNRLAVLFGHG